MPRHGRLPRSRLAASFWDARPRHAGQGEVSRPRVGSTTVGFMGVSFWDRAGVALSALGLPRSSSTDRRPLGAPTREGADSVCVAGLVPKASAAASAERRGKKHGDDNQGDDSGAGDEQCAIHGDLLSRMVVSHPLQTPEGRKSVPVTVAPPSLDAEAVAESAPSSPPPHVPSARAATRRRGSSVSSMPNSLVRWCFPSPTADARAGRFQPGVAGARADARAAPLRPRGAGRAPSAPLPRRPRLDRFARGGRGPSPRDECPILARPALPARGTASSRICFVPSAHPDQPAPRQEWRPATTPPRRGARRRCAPPTTQRRRPSPGGLHGLLSSPRGVPRRPGGRGHRRAHPVPEAARALRIPEGTLTSRMSRARDRMARRLGGEDPNAGRARPSADQ